jgi:hypothetical protein
MLEKSVSTLVSSNRSTLAWRSNSAADAPFSTSPIALSNVRTLMQVPAGGGEKKKEKKKVESSE